MSVTRVKMLAAETHSTLEKLINDFLSNEKVEIKQFNYETNGYEKPYSAAILYHERGQLND